jgi:hypothetical protein
MMAAEEAARLAVNLARNCGYAVFPCGENKKPVRPKHLGGSGYKEASTDPDRISWLWKHFPGSLIGIATGERSGVSVLDVDIKHDTARAWFHQNCSRIPETETYRTRGGGIHIYFRHAPGIRISEGKPVPGVDVRGHGGYVISWFAAGCECLDHSTPAPWPVWLRDVIWPPPQPRTAYPKRNSEPISDKLLNAVKENVLRKVRDAADGQKHFRLRAQARVLGGIQERAGFTTEEAVQWLLDALPDSALDLDNAKNTAAWGLAKGREKPLEFDEGRT